MITKKTKLIGSIALLAAIVVVSGFVTFMYLLIQLKETHSEYAHQVAQARANEAELNALVQLVSESENERAELNTYLLDADGIIEFLSLLSTLGEEQGISITTPTVRTADATTDAYEKLEVVVEVEGPYATITHFLATLEQLPYQSSVTDVRLVRTDETSAESSAVDEWKGTYSLVVTKYKEAL